MTIQRTKYRCNPIDLHELLYERQLIAVIWSTEDVLRVRPDLTDEQAWRVLRECDNEVNCEIDLTWAFIEQIAAQIYPLPASSPASR